MNEALHNWCERAWSAAATLPGGVGRELRARWDTHAGRDRVVVTFFGPYDSGKSSLLKRLLVDDGQTVPDWLTVSGRRETFEPHEASVAGVIVRDTPGIAGGNDLHKTAANEALLLSDAVVLVLPPQLVTSDRESILAVLSGRRFGCPPNVAYAERGITVVLSRMDEAGAMPRDDIAGYRALVKRKRDELAEILRSEGIPEDLVEVHAVAADAFGLIGNARPSGRADYDADRQWDGVSALADFLNGLAARRTELRQHAEARFLGAEIGSIRDSLAQLDAGIRAAAEAAANEATSHALAQDRLQALLGAARADLDRRIEEEVSAASRRGAADVKELRDVVSGRLDAALERWSKVHDSALEALIRESNTELKSRRERLAWKMLVDILDDASATPEPAGSDKEVRQKIDKVQRIAKTLHRAFREALPVAIDMPIDKARSEVQRFKNAGSFEVYVAQTAKAAVRFRDLEHVTLARQAVRLDNFFDAALPAILELGSLVAEVAAEQKIVQQRAARREEVRRIIEESSKQLADRAWSLWRDEGMPSALEAALAEARTSTESVATSLRAEGEGIMQVLRALEGILDAAQTLQTP